MSFNLVIIQKVEVRLPSGHVEQLTTSQLTGLYRDLDAWLKRNAANLNVAWEGQKLSVLCSICNNPKCDSPNGKH